MRKATVYLALFIDQTLPTAISARYYRQAALDLKHTNQQSAARVIRKEGGFPQTLETYILSDMKKRSEAGETIANL